MQSSLLRFFQHKSVNFSGFHTLRITMAVGPSWFRKLLICKKVFAFSYIFTHISRFYRILISFSFEANSSGIFFASCFSASLSSSWRMSLVNTPAHPQQRFNDVYVLLLSTANVFGPQQIFPRLVPGLGGLGYGLLCIPTMIAFYYTVIMAWAFYFMFQVNFHFLPLAINNGSYSGHEKRIAMDQLYHRTSHWILHKPLFH